MAFWFVRYHLELLNGMYSSHLTAQSMMEEAKNLVELLIDYKKRNDSLEKGSSLAKKADGGQKTTNLKADQYRSLFLKSIRFSVLERKQSIGNDNSIFSFFSYGCTGTCQNHIQSLVPDSNYLVHFRNFFWSSFL